MSRRRAPAGATISLFPFLAVLLCTMGALLVLLVIFSRRAKESESAAALAAEQEQAAEIELARDELQWRLEQLQGVRARTTEDLARERMRLAGVEEDARKLADELDALERTATALEATVADSGGADAVAAAERRLAASRAALDEARAAGAKKPAAYAVVPYEGVNGTHRRPLYVECCIDGVFLQPEGIRLGPADFEGPPGPGNPLASALRAAREHLAQSPGESGDPAAQPYPLLLVRPSGVMAYYAAREALVSWGSEFGYQFVDEDWQLKYPPADPALAAVERRAVDESRRRIEWLAQVRPQRPAKPTQQYRASTTRGGVVAEGGPSVLGDRSRFDWTEQQAAGVRAGGDGDGAGGGHAAGGGDVVLGGVSGARDGGGGRGSRASGTEPGGNGTRGSGGGGSGGSGSGSRGSGTGGTAGDRYAGPSRFYAGQPAGDGATEGEGTGVSGGSHATGSAAGSASGRAGGGPGAASVGAAEGAADGAAAEGGTSALAGGGATAAAGGTTAGSAAAAGAGSGGSAGGPALPGMMSQGGTATAGGSATASGSLAGARGSNWASLATAERPIPLTRPIRVECAAHEFRVFDDGGTRVETRVPIGTRTADAVDPLVQAVHGRVGRWGLAGDRMYWRPELVLSETADGRSRREDLERLLADSGLDTRRTRTDAEVRLLPPITRTSGAAARR